MNKDKVCYFFAGVMNLYEDLLSDGELMASIVPLNTVMFYHDLKMSRTFDAGIFAEYCHNVHHDQEYITVEEGKELFISFIRKRYEGWAKANEL